MRKMKIVTLVLLCIITIGLCGIFVYGMTGHDIYMLGFDSRSAYVNNGSMHLVLDEEVSLDGIDSISIQYDMNSNDIYIYESEGELLTVKEYSEIELDKDKTSTIKTTGSSLEVRGSKRNTLVRFHFFGVGPAGGYVEIGLPSSYTGMLCLASLSGDIKSQMDILLEKDFEARTSSGDISLPNVEASNASVSSTSGNVKIETLCTDSGKEHGESAGRIEIETSSGNINAEQLTGKLDIGSTSGDITLKQLTGETRIESSSGFVRSEILTGNVQITTTSGDITMECIDGPARAESSSGNIRIYAGSGERTVRTTSGDILIEGVNQPWSAHSSSGTVLLKASEGHGEIQTTSGDITLELGKLTGNLDIDSSSGFAKIKLSQDNAFDFEARTSSGDIDTFFDEDLHFSKRGDSAQGTYKGGGDGKCIRIETTSGDVQVLKNS